MTLIALTGAVAQALRISNRSDQAREMIAEIEPLLFEMESGQREDLVRYGGKEKLSGDRDLEIKTAGIEKQFHRSEIKYRAAQKDFFTAEVYWAGFYAS